jgi:hypothetical protein
MKTAIRPDFYFKQMPSLKQVESEAQKSGASEEEMMIYTMSQMAGWRIMDEFISKLIKDLDTVNKQAIANGEEREEIGRNAVVVSLTQDILNRLQLKVLDAIEACNPNGQ